MGIDFNTVVYAWIGLAVVLFPVQVFIPAPYGRHIKKSWGPLLDNRLGWIIMEMPALLCCPLFVLLSGTEKSVVVWFFIALWVIHYTNRVLIFPFRMRTPGKKIPFSIVLSAIFFNVVNGLICGYYFGYIGNAYPVEWIYSLPFITGLLAWTVGFAINMQSDHILLRLRKPGETGYRIPYGGLFGKVSCPNHFGEIVEWFGFAMMTWAIPPLSFAVWTTANLVPRALSHHRWYREKFRDYPQNRKAVIPYIL